MKPLFVIGLVLSLVSAVASSSAAQVPAPLPGMLPPGVTIPGLTFPGTSIPGVMVPGGGVQFPSGANVNLPATNGQGTSLEQYLQRRYLQSLANRRHSSSGPTMGVNPFFTPDMNNFVEQPQEPSTKPAQGKLSAEKRKSAVRALAEKQKAAALQRIEARKAQAAGQ